MIGKSFSLSTDKQSRYELENGETEIASSTYNMIMGFIILYGLVANLIICNVLKGSLNSFDFWETLIGYLICAVIGILVCGFSDHYIFKFIGYNLLVVPLGAVLSILLRDVDYLEIHTAFFLATIIAVVQMFISTLFPKLFLSLGNAFGAALIVTVGIELLFFFGGLEAGFYTWVGVCVFSLYIGYDWAKANEYMYTVNNAIDSAMDIYLDFINLFIRIFRLIVLTNVSSSD